MAFANGQKLKSGLDDGHQKPKRRKGEDAATEPLEVPRIRPGEKLGDFSARVYAALPMAGLRSKGRKDPLDPKVHRTRKEKKMHKLYDQWREEDRKIKERREEELELAAERELDDEFAGASASLALLGAGQPGQKRSKRARRQGLGGEEDTWAEIERRRAEAKVGLHDVALCPPELRGVSSKRRLAVNGASVDVGNVPKSAGSLHRREQLNKVGESVVATYRHLRDKRRSAKRSFGDEPQDPLRQDVRTENLDA